MPLPQWSQLNTFITPTSAQCHAAYLIGGFLRAAVLLGWKVGRSFLAFKNLYCDFSALYLLNSFAFLTVRYYLLYQTKTQILICLVEHRIVKVRPLLLLACCTTCYYYES